MRRVCVGLVALAIGCSDGAGGEASAEYGSAQAALGVAEEIPPMSSVIRQTSSCTAVSAISPDQLVQALTNGGFVILGRDARSIGTTTITSETPDGVLWTTADELGVSDIEIVGDSGFVPDSILVPRHRSMRLVDHAGVEHVPSLHADEPSDMQSLREGRPASFAVLVAPREHSVLVAQVFERAGRIVRISPEVDVSIDEIASAAHTALGEL